MQTENKKYYTLGLIIVLLLSNIFFITKWVSLSSENSAQEYQQIATVRNEKIVNFTKLFIEKVLKSEGEVDFETRLTLENSVRAIGDEEILNQWEKFTESDTERQAQIEVKNLLEMLVSKI